MYDTRSHDMRYVVKWTLILGGFNVAVQYTAMTIVFFFLV